MKYFFRVLLVLLMLSFVPAQARDVAVPRYIDPTTVDAKVLLPEPFAKDSPETLKEIDAVLEKQKTRTPDEVARAQSEVKLTVFAFSDVLGPWFTEKNLPKTAAFFQSVHNDAHFVTDAAKKVWNRPRPYEQSTQVQPAVELEKNGSYPSGHATRGMLFGLILADLFPDLKDKLIARGRQIGDDRVLGGVHFPSDVAGGQTLGKALYDKFNASPTFQADLAVVKAELKAAAHVPIAN